MRKSEKVPAIETQQKKDKEENWITSLPFDLEHTTKRVAGQVKPLPEALDNRRQRHSFWCIEHLSSDPKVAVSDSIARLISCK